MNPRSPATENGSLDTDTLSPVWSAGWQWPWVVTLTVMLGGNFLLAPEQVYVGSFLLVGGLSLAVAGVRAVEPVEPRHNPEERVGIHTSGMERPTGCGFRTSVPGACDDPIGRSDSPPCATGNEVLYITQYKAVVSPEDTTRNDPNENR